MNCIFLVMKRKKITIREKIKGITGPKMALLNVPLYWSARPRN